MTRLPIKVGFFPPDRRELRAGDEVAFRVGLCSEVDRAFFSGELEVAEDLEGALLEIQLLTESNGSVHFLGTDLVRFHPSRGWRRVFDSLLRKPGVIHPRLRLFRKDQGRQWSEGTLLGEIELDPMIVQPEANLPVDSWTAAEVPLLAQPAGPVEPMAELPEALGEFELNITGSEESYTLTGVYSGFTSYATAQLPMSRFEFLKYVDSARDNLDKESKNYERSFGPGAKISDDEQRERWRKATHRVAEIGRNLYQRVLWHQLPVSAADPRGQLLRKISALPTGALLRIRSGRLVLPWNILYDRDLPPSGEFSLEHLKGFWGYRYRIQEVPGAPDEERQLTMPARQLCAWVDPTLGESNPKSEVLQEIASLHRESFSSQRHLLRNCTTELLPEPPGSVRDPQLQIKTVLAQRIEATASSHLLYFFCHGSGPRSFTSGLLKAQAAALRLTTLGPDHVLTPDDLQEWRNTRLTAAGWNAEPLIFLNCCETGRVDPFSVSSLIDAFVSFLRARAVICCYWEVPARFASEYAEELFDVLLKPEPETVGDALYALRRRYLEQFNPFGLVYAVFGDSKIKMLDEPPSESMPVEAALAS